MTSRRSFLAAGAIAGLGLTAGGYALWRRRRPGAPDGPDAPAADLVALLEQTERDRVLEALAPRLAAGLRPGALGDALLAAATRQVVPRTTFSKEHHILICVRAAQRAGEALAGAAAWQPLLWAVDYFKWAQTQAQDAGSPPMEPLDDRALPAGAPGALQAAMDGFDGAGAELAIAAFHRAGRHDELAGALARHGARDLRHIGHKLIHTSSVLETVRFGGWQGAEPALRSLARTLALHYDEPGRDLDGPWVHAGQAAGALRADWTRGDDGRAHVLELLAAYRTAGSLEAIDATVRAIDRGASATAVWDAIFLSGAELMFNYPTAVEALHAVTAANAGHAVFLATQDEPTRRRLLLQGAARVTDFHRYTASWALRRKVPAAHDLAIERLEPSAIARDPATALDEIFADIGVPATRPRAAQRTLAFLAADPAHAGRLAARAAVHAVTRAQDTHDLKLWAAADQDHARVSPPWRAAYLAACTARLRGTSEPTSPLAARIGAITAAI